MDTVDDATILMNLLSELRSEARLYLDQAKEDGHSADMKNHFVGLAECLYRRARALHSLMVKSGIRGCGPAF